MNINNDPIIAGYDRKMSNPEINDFPLYKFNGPITLVKSSQDIQLLVQELQNEKVLGFDIEIRPSFKKGESYPPSLLQLAGRKNIYLIQLHKVGIPDDLNYILEDPKIVKAGVSIKFDIIKLREIRQFEKKGFIDIAELAKKKGLKNFGLRGLAAVLLKIRIPKGAQTTNWSKDNLTEQQLRYAATDAWAGREIYLKLKGEGEG
jgi:ribonuclease D